MRRLRQARAKAAYSLLVKHVIDEDVKTILGNTHFQNGHAALVYMDTNYDRPLDRSELRELNRTWDDLSIPKDVGTREASFHMVADALRASSACRQGEREALKRRSPLYAASILRH